MVVPVTAVEAVCSLGQGFGEIAAALNAGKIGLSTNHRFQSWSKTPLGEIDHSAFESYNTKLQDLDCRYFRIIYAMVEKILKRTDLLNRYSSKRIGIFFGTSTSALDHTQSAFYQFTKGGDQSHFQKIRDFHINAAAVKMLKKFFPIHGVDATISTACSSSAHAIAEGYSAIQCGTIDAAIVGGFDILNEVTICGFDSLQILDSNFCQPFCKERQGTNLSEGGAFLVLERETNLKPLSYLVGTGASSDAYQMTLPDPQGEGMFLAMQRALDDAKILPSQISYINAHGTATEPNDRTEALAIYRIFKRDEKSPSVSSSKAYHGHCLGGSGALEAAISIASLLQNKIWPALQKSSFEYNDLVRHATFENSQKPLNYVLSNSFGFGGNNASLIFKSASSEK